MSTIEVAYGSTKLPTRGMANFTADVSSFATTFRATFDSTEHSAELSTHKPTN